MGIGLSVLLLAAGAILAFAVDATANGVDLDAVGVILMIAGAIGLIVDLAIFAPRRRASTVTTHDSYDPAYDAAPAGGRRRTVRRDEIV